MKIGVKKLTQYATIPTKGSRYAAGYDLYSGEQQNIHLYPRTTQKVRTGLAMEIPEGYFGAIYPRSGLATKEELRLSNCVGIIDSDYRGDIIVPVFNDGIHMRTIRPKQRIAQLIIQKYEDVDFVKKTELSETVRGNGGFGSTGKD